MNRSRLETQQRDQARDWLSRLKDAHSAADREAFEQWLAKDPAHRRAYDAVSAAYGESGVLRMSKIGRARDLEAAFPSRKLGLVGVLAAASAAAFLVLGAYELGTGSLWLRPMPLESVMLSSGSEARSIRLADGSGIELLPSSEVRIELGRKQRLALVRRGHIRLRIAAETRPFRIVAGSASREVRAGSFDASIDGSEGRITPDPVAFIPSGSAAGADRGSPRPSEPSRQAMEFSAEPLGQAIGRINAVGAGPPIEIDPRLSRLRVTGVFQQGSTEEIAHSLAVAFGLELTTTSSGTLRLAR